MRRRSLFRSFARWLQGIPRPISRRHIGSRRVRVEPLEERRLLAAVLYVNDDAVGLNTGVSWADAYTDLQSALAAATSGDEVWVAAGGYEAQSSIPRFASFALKSDVSLYGGFAGTEIAREQRDWTTNVTVLSGGDTHHVLQARDVTGAVLDGFIVTRGCTYAFGGGGIECNGGSLSIRNVTFLNNRVCTYWHPTLPATDPPPTVYGGGAAFFSADTIELTNVVFQGNTADIYHWGSAYGGGLYCDAHTTVLRNVVFDGNTAAVAGGGMYYWGGATASNSPLTLTNVTFSGNSGGYGGSALDVRDGSSTLTNCILWGNHGIPIDSVSSSSMTVADSIVEGGWAGEGNLDADPRFVDAGNGDFHLQAASPAIDAGTAAGAPDTDLDGNRRPLDGDGDGTPGVDMGAYEFKASNLAPVADAAGPYTVVVDHTVMLVGAASQDADGTLTLYEWDFDYDGSTFNVDTTGVSPTFSAASLQSGDSRTVALRVTDNDGAVSPIDVTTLTAIAPQFTPALYDPAASTFYLRCANTTGVADHTFAYGQTDAGWKTLVGDWDGDDTSGVGLYDPNASTFYLTNAYESGFAQYTFGYGESGKGWIPLVGDWDGDGHSGVGLYDPNTSTFYLTNSLDTGVAQYTFAYGEANAGWMPLVGDWNGDGRTGVGLFNPHTSTFYLTSTFQTGFAEHTFGYGEPDAGWQPLVGDWNGDHTDGVGLFAPKSSTFYLTNAFVSGYAQYAFGYGQPDAGWTPLVGDWNGNGATGVGLVCPASSTFYLTDTLTSGYAEYTVGFGQPGANWQPLVGCWTTAGSQGQTYNAQAVDQLDLADLAADALNPIDAEPTG
jgi:hypothetical protein